MPISLPQGTAELDNPYTVVNQYSVGEEQRIETTEFKFDNVVAQYYQQTESDKLADLARFNATDAYAFLEQNKQSDVAQDAAYFLSGGQTTFVSTEGYDNNRRSKIVNPQLLNALSGQANIATDTYYVETILQKLQQAESESATEANFMRRQALLNGRL